MAEPKFYQSPGVLEGEDLDREERRLQAELLKLESNPSSGQPYKSGPFLTLNMDRVTDVARTERLRNALETVKKKKSDFQGKYLEEVARRLRAFREEEEGAPGKEPTIPNDDEGNPMPLVGGREKNPLAYKNYLADPYPEVRGMASQREKNNDELIKELRKRASFTSAQRAGDDPRGLTEKPEFKEMNGAWWNTAGENGPVMAGQPVRQIPHPNEPGKQTNVYPGGKVDLGGGGVRVENNMPGERTGRDILLKGLDKDKEKAVLAADQFAAAQQGLQALSEGAQTGMGAETVEKLKSSISYFTGIKFDSKASYGVLSAALAANTIKELGGLGAQVSNTDRVFMQDATGGTMNTPEALERLLAIRAGHTYRYLIKTHPEQVKLGAAGSENPEVASAIEQKYRVEVPALSGRFKTVEAEASFLAGMKNIPYPQALEEVKKMRKEEGSSAPALAEDSGRQQELDRIMRKDYSIPNVRNPRRHGGVVQ